MRIDKILAHLGYGSRKDIKKILKTTHVEVNGVRIKDTKHQVKIDADTISIDGEQVIYNEHVYFMLNKPKGVISATVDPEHQTVLELIRTEDFRKDLFPVGRLDKDTTGLLLITNDGELAHKLLSPKKHVAKKYSALIDGNVTEEDIEAFHSGVVLNDGYKTLPAEMTVLNSGQYSEIEIIIQEGKFHQIKRMFLARGKKVVDLKRLEMGSLILDPSLENGQYRPLTDSEQNRLKSLKV